MRFTKFEHSGWVIEKNGQKIVCDPVEFTVTLPELDNVAAMIITHRHADHLQPEKISWIRDRNPGMRIFTTADAASEIPGAEVVKDGNLIEIGGFALKFFGKNHAEIIPGKISCQNIGVVVDGKIVNPGDSFDMPDDVSRPKVLLVPSAAPWCKVSEGMAYIQQTVPEIAVPVHNAVLSEFGNGVNNNCLRMACDETGSQFAPLEAGESIEI